MWRQLVLASVMALVLGLLPPPAPALAAVFTVNRLTDPFYATGACPTECTLRNAITAAAPGDTIQFGVTGTILLDHTLTLTKNVSIQGPGVATLAVDGQGLHTVFEVSAGVTASLSSMTIQRGVGEYAGGVANLGGSVSLLNVVVKENRGRMSGGIHTDDGTLTITTSTITNNQARASNLQLAGYGQGGGIGSVRSAVTVSGTTISDNITHASWGYGGGVAITEAGTFRIDRSTISGNSAVDGGGIWNVLGDLTITNSTISGNIASERGGGIMSNGGTTSLVHATVSDNVAPVGGAIQTGGPVTLRNSILTDGPDGSLCDVGGSGVVTSNGNNLTDSTSCFPANAAQGDIVTSTPLLGPLALNAPGTTMTHALLYGSPAVDGVRFAPPGSPPGTPIDCPTTIVVDQRGQARPQAWTVPRCDIGAYELTGTNTAPSIQGIATQNVTANGPVPALFVNINDSETPGSLTVTGTSSNQQLVPNGNIAVSGSGLLRSLTVTPAANQSGDATITLTVSDGFATASTAFLFRVTPAPVTPVPITPVPVTPVNALPVAVNDAYSINVTETLNVTVGLGVLANDTDSDSPSLTAQLLQQPANGTLVLLPTGAFTYTPTGTFAGTDTFTYRAWDGTAASANAATVTITVRPTACTPRPAVNPQVTAGGSTLQVRVESTPMTGRPAGPLRKLQFGTLQNANVTIGGQTIASGDEYTVPGNASAIEFTVTRIVAGQPTTVPLTVVDDCGVWKTLVGGGANAGF
jgi:hypothetical protein